MEKQSKHPPSADNSDVFTQLSQLLESSYLHKSPVASSSFPSSSSRRMDTADSRTDNRVNDNGYGSIGDESSHLRGGGMSCRSRGGSSQSTNRDQSRGSDRDQRGAKGAISFKAWKNKLLTTDKKLLSTADKKLPTGDTSASNGTSEGVRSAAGSILSSAAGDAESSQQLESERWADFLERVNQKEKEKRRSIKSERKRLKAVESEECFFSPNLTTRSLRMAACFDPLRDRIPRLLEDREAFLEQQRLLLEQREVAECTFTPTRVSAGRSALYLQNIGDRLMTPENYKPYLEERRRRDDILRCEILERDSVELTFRPKTNSNKALSSRRAHTPQEQARPKGEEEDGWHERLYQMGQRRLTRHDEIHHRTLKKDPPEPPDPSVPSRPHAACERLYRDGLQRLGATMPTTEANISATYKAPPSPTSCPPPFSPRGVRAPHPSIPRPRRGTRGSSSSRMSTATRETERREEEDPVGGVDGGRSCVDSYVSVVSCGGEESPSYLTLWNDLRCS